MKRTGLLVAGVMVLVVFIAAGCVPSPETATRITLSEAIALSKTHNIQEVLFEPDKGTMTITTAVTGQPINIADPKASRRRLPMAR